MTILNQKIIAEAKVSVTKLRKCSSTNKGLLKTNTSLLTASTNFISKKTVEIPQKSWRYTFKKYIASMINHSRDACGVLSLVKAYFHYMLSF